MFTIIQRFLIVLLEILCCKAWMEAFAGKRQELSAPRMKAGASLWKQGAMVSALAAGVCFVFPFTVIELPLQHILKVGVMASPVKLSPVFAGLCRFLGIGASSPIAVCVLPGLQQVLYMGAVSLCMAFCLRISRSKAILLASGFQALLLAADVAAARLYIAFFHRIHLMRDLCHVEGSLIAISGRCALFFFVLLFWCVRRRALSTGDQGKMQPLVHQTVFFALCAGISVVLAWQSVRPGEMERLYFFILFALLCLATAALYLLDSLLKREGKAYKRAMFHIKAQGQAELYRTLSENYGKQQKKVHEYKNQILCIESLLRRKMYQELEEYVSSISGGLGRELDDFQTNHPIADAVINRAYQEMLEKDILFVPKISDLSGIWVSDGDLVAILSNLLENAIEACGKCQGRRIIKMKLVIEEGGIVLSVRNTYEGQLKEKDGEFQTTKAQGEGEHGIGLKNVMEVVEGYGGAYVVQTGGGEFYIAVLIPR